MVEDDAGRVLLALRAHDPRAGQWDLPGGYLEEGEHPEEGVRRELREEAGVEVAIDRLIGLYIDETGYATGGHTLNCHYLCHITDGFPTPNDDVEELRWFAADALPEQIAFDNARAALRDWKRQKENA